jgi:hypothetical protein
MNCACFQFLLERWDFRQRRSLSRGSGAGLHSPR